MVTRLDRIKSYDDEQMASFMLMIGAEVLANPAGFFDLDIKKQKDWLNA